MFHKKLHMAWLTHLLEGIHISELHAGMPKTSDACKWCILNDSTATWPHSQLAMYTLLPSNSSTLGTLLHTQPVCEIHVDPLGTRACNFSAGPATFQSSDPCGPSTNTVQFCTLFKHGRDKNIQFSSQLTRATYYRSI